jgi:hypothetical protein
MRPNIRRPLFDGMREIHAIWFDVALIGEAQARRRVLAWWQAGARLHRAADGYVLTLARPQYADCDTLDGLALCRVDGILSSAPLAADERHAVPHGGCWLVRGAQALTFSLTAAEAIDPAAWIDLGAIAIREPLKFPVAKARATLDAPEESKSLRDILEGAIPPPSKRREEFLQAVQAQVHKKKGGGIGRAAASAGMAAAAGAGLLAMFASMLFGRRSGTGTGTGTGSRAANGRPSAPARPQPNSPWKQRLYAAAARLAEMTSMSRLIGWRQAAYLRKMVDMFERGDVAEALRHAIPIDGDATSERQALGAPQARSSLDITAPGGTTSVIGLDPQVQNYLRQSYRQLFQRLEREGRIDEATFVLAELLHAGVEAVDYLERNGRLKQAAQLAETLELAPGIAVRLWLLAGDAPRAIRIARLKGAFAEAVLLLERKQHPEAAMLRSLWGEYLFERGDLIEAAEAIWPIEKYRDLALTWLLQAEQAGRTLGARALVRKLALMPDSLAASVPAISALLESQADDGAQLRASLATELIALGAHSTATSRLAGEVLRYVIPERDAGLNQLDKRMLNTLLTCADAALLKSDLPPLEFGKAQVSAVPNYGASPASNPLQAQHDQRGLMQIHDARRLPDGHYLIALGESGVVRINGAGKQLVHFPLPAYHLVLAQNGERALALARRGDVVRASRIDLTTCKVSDWLSHPFDSWADQFDGVVWNAVIDNRIVAIDTSKDTLSVIWQIADLPGQVIDFLDDGATQTILLANDQELQQWRYVLPARRLTQREVVPLPSDGSGTKVLAHGASTFPLLLSVTESADGTMLSARRPGRSHLLVALGQVDPKSLKAEVKDGWLLVHSRSGEGGYRCQVVDRKVDAIVAELRLPLAQQPAVAAHDNHLLVFDRAGRLIDVDFATGTVRSMTLS